jgi:hypothetical protein
MDNDANEAAQRAVVLKRIRADGKRSEIEDIIITEINLVAWPAMGQTSKTFGS